MDHAPGVPPIAAAAPGRDIPGMLRLGVSAGLVLGWLVMLLFAWAAFSTLPSPERLQESRMTGIPTLATAGTLLLRSALELSALLVLLWPARRLYLTRVAAAIAGLGLWFVVTVPLTVTSMSWVHRRWLAAMVIALSGVLIAGIAGALARRTMSSPAQQLEDERNHVEL